MNRYSKEIEEACNDYRPRLNNGNFADVTITEILEDVGQIFYIRATDPSEKQFLLSYSLIKHMSPKVRDAYENSKHELQPLMLALLSSAEDIGQEIEDYASGKINRDNIPLGPEHDLIISLLVRMSRDTFIGHRDLSILCE